MSTEFARRRQASETKNPKAAEPQRDSRRELFDQWRTRYSETGRPVPVRFAELTDKYHLKDRHTHVVHTYPAKLLSVIPEFFIDVLSDPGDTVLDPFSGSGTVALEAVLAGRVAAVAEVNPLARLITRVKTTPVPGAILRAQWEDLSSSIDLRRSSVGTLPKILTDWHSVTVLRQMSAIRNSLQAWTPTCAPNLRACVRDFFWLMFSSIVRRVSLADPRIAPPVRMRAERFPKGSAPHLRVLEQLRRKRSADCVATFAAAVENGIRRVTTLDSLRASKCAFVANDARDVPRNVGAQLVLTSPPYMAAQKYTRTTSLEMYWLGLLEHPRDRKALEDRVIGSEYPRLARGQACPGTGNDSVDSLVAQLWKVNRARAKIVADYFASMFSVLGALERALADGGHIVCVVGNNTVCGRTVPVYRLLERYCREVLALETEAVLVDPIRQFGLLTKRHRTAGIIKREHILVMRKRDRGQTHVSA